METNLLCMGLGTVFMMGCTLYVLVRWFILLCRSFWDSEEVPREVRWEECPACHHKIRAEYLTCPECDLTLTSSLAKDLRDLKSTLRKLHDFEDRGLLDAATAQKVQQLCREQRSQLLNPRVPEPSAPVGTAVLLEAIPILPVPPLKPPEIPRVAVPVEAEPGERGGSSAPPLEPLAPRTWGQVMSSFMEERNILWGELVGGLLIVGCSLALVVSLWNTLERIPLFPFAILAAITVVLFLAGWYTLHHWKLASTSRGLVVIALLLVPLDFLVLAGLSRDLKAGLVEILISLGTIGGFSWLAQRAFLVLTPGHPWVSTLGLIGASTVALLVPLSGVPMPTEVMLGLTCVAVAFQVGPTGWLLWSRRLTTWDEAQGRGLLASLGLTTFALALTLGFTATHGADITETLALLSFPTTAAAWPLLHSGLLLFQNRGTGDNRPTLSPWLSTLGSGVAVAGAMVLLGSLALAFPFPEHVLMVALVDTVFFLWVAWKAQVPLANLPAWGCVACAALAASALLSPLPGNSFPAQLLEPRSGLILTGVVVGAAGTLYALVRRNRLADAWYTGIGTLVLATFSLLLLWPREYAEFTRLSPVCGIYAFLFFALNRRWCHRGVPWVVAGLGLGALLCGVIGLQERLPNGAERIAVVLAHTTLLLLASRWSSPRNPANAHIYWDIAQGMMVLTTVAILGEILNGNRGILGAESLGLAVLSTTLGILRGRPPLMALGQGALALASVLALSVWPILGDQPGDGVHLQAYLGALAMQGLIWAGIRRIPGAPRLLEPSWPMLDRGILGISVTTGLLVALFWLRQVLEYGNHHPYLTPWETGLAWVALGLSSLAVLTLLPREPLAGVVGLIVVGLTACLRLALLSDPDQVADTLRLSLASGFLAFSLPLWFRERLGAGAQSWGITGLGQGRIALPARWLIVLTTVLPVIVLTLARPKDHPLSFATDLLPLVLVASTLVLYGAREQAPGYLLSGGWVVHLGATLLVLHVFQGASGPSLVLALLQANTIIGSLICLLWLLLGKESPVALGLRTVELVLTVLVGSVIPLGPIFHLLVSPQVPLSSELAATGEGFSWLALGLTTGAVVWHLLRVAPWATGHVLAPVWFSAGVLTACFVARWDTGNWLSFHGMMGIWSLGGLSLSACGVAWGSLKGPQRLQAPVWLRIGLPLLAGGTSLLALRALEDPWAPTPAALATLLTSAGVAVVGVWFRSALAVVFSGLLLNLMGFLLWSANGPSGMRGLLLVQGATAALAALAWTVAERGLHAANLVRDLKDPIRPFRRLAVGSSLALLGVVSYFDLADHFQHHVSTGEILPWAGLGSLALVLGSEIRHKSRSAPFGLYLVGLLAIAWTLPRFGLKGEDVVAVAAVLLASLVLVAAVLIRYYLRKESSDIEYWIPLQTFVGVFVLGGSAWASLVLPGFWERLAGPVAVMALTLATNLMDRGRSLPGRSVVWLLSAGFFVELSWAILGVDLPALTLHRTVVALAAVQLTQVLALVVAGVGRSTLTRSLPTALLRGLALLIVLGIMVQQLVLFDPHPDIKRTPLIPWAVTLVLLLLTGQIVGSVRQALATGQTSLTYVAEILVVFLGLHVRLNMPWLFGGWLIQYWTFLVMGLAFLTLGAAEVLARRRLTVLSGPLENTGFFLPWIPLLAFWVRPPAVVETFLLARVPGLEPLFLALDRIPTYLSTPSAFDRYALLWFLLGGFYAFLALTRRSWRNALIASVLGNVGLWCLLHHHGWSFFVHPQTWLIPLSAIVLVAEHLNRQRLSPQLAASLRYVALMLLYLSSTADMFLAGLGKSLALPLVLAGLSVAGVMTGILLRVRAFVTMGIVFLVVVLFSMIWHAAVDLAQTWVWWVSGIALGVLILAIFALFEKRRDEVFRLTREWKEWQ